MISSINPSIIQTGFNLLKMVNFSHLNKIILIISSLSLVKQLATPLFQNLHFRWKHRVTPALDPMTDQKYTAHFNKAFERIKENPHFQRFTERLNLSNEAVQKSYFMQKLSGGTCYMQALEFREEVDEEPTSTPKEILTSANPENIIYHAFSEYIVCELQYERPDCIQYRPGIKGTSQSGTFPVESMLLYQTVFNHSNPNKNSSEMQQGVINIKRNDCPKGHALYFQFSKEKQCFRFYDPINKTLGGFFEFKTEEEFFKGLRSHLLFWNKLRTNKCDVSYEFFPNKSGS